MAAVSSAELGMERRCTVTDEVCPPLTETKKILLRRIFFDRQKCGAQRCISVLSTKLY